MIDENQLLAQQVKKAQAATKPAKQLVIYPDTGTNENARALTPGALQYQANAWAQILQNAGFPSDQRIYFPLAQMMLESAWITSREANEDLNYSGIKFLGNPKIQNATRGNKSPEGDYYAKYPNANAWAQDYARVLRLNRGSGRPIDATTVDDFLTRLKANGYFTDPNYSSKYKATYQKMMSWLKSAQDQDASNYAALQKGQTIFTADSAKGVVPGKIIDSQSIEAWWNGLKPLAKGGIVAAGFLILLKALD